MIMAGLIGALIAAIITVIALNFVAGEKQIQRKLEHRYADRRPTVPSRARHPAGAADHRRQSRRATWKTASRSSRRCSRPSGVRAKPSTSKPTSTGRARSVASSRKRSRNGRGRASQVHVLIDWVGSQKMEQALLDTMTAAGVQVERYHPLHWYHLARMNNRTHRKLLIVDGEVGFTGGVGIADNWDGDATIARSLARLALSPAGPGGGADAGGVHGQLDQDHRHGAAGGGVLPGAAGRGRRSGAGVHQFAEWRRRQHAADVPAVDHGGRAHDRLVGCLFRPRRTDPAGAPRGARSVACALRIIVPGEHIDTEVVRKASRAQWGELLAAGAEIHEFQPTMFHCKMLIVDQLMVSVGSTNFDNRSFRLNDEANLNVYDRRVRGACQRRLRGRSQASTTHYLRGMESPPLAGKAARACIGASVVPALIRAPLASRACLRS